ncbi:MAG: response regulator containing CheY-like receiver, AAA-type ATPase, and DNA-binding domain protein [uncultured archaeon A07HN63]|nr:MAG: response regulator containing CheY-like receiver, AAA-type ATPase, and DNA-binding domain protein [uncultured archaeon A07HN63]
MSKDITQQQTGDALSIPAEILIIDDDQQWLTLVIELLTEKTTEFSVVTADSLATGRGQFDADTFDCVVCDYRLGDGTGLELLKEVRASHPELPFLLMTSRGDESVAADAISLGVTDYLEKELIREAFDTPEESVLATKLRTIIRSYRTRRALAAEREIKTAAMDLLTTMSNQSELYRQFCDLLHTEHGYDGVWIGTVGAGGRIIPRAVSGCGGYLQTLNLSTADDPRWFDPAVRALEQESLAVSTADEDQSDKPWSDDWDAASAEFGFNSGIGVPIGDDRVQFGVLGAYTADTRITDSQRRLLREFAQIISYTVRTDEWKESITSDEPVRLEIEIEAPDSPLLALADRLSPDGSLDVQSVARHKDGEMLYAISATGAEWESLEEWVAETEHTELFDVTKGGAGNKCMLLIEPPTPESIARDYGMQFKQITIDSGIRAMIGYLPTGSALPNLLADLRSAFEETTARSVTSNAVAVSTMSTNRVHTTTEAQLLEPLTNRQREILSHAFDSGYFDDPRETTATELADRFGIARATFSQHLRAAQRKLLEAVLDEEGSQ